MAKRHCILMGPPGAGKGTQAAMIASAYDFEHISTGDVLRREVSKCSDLGKRAKTFMNRGDLVPSSLVIEMIASRIDDGTGKKGFLYDGFPRNREQAEVLEEMLQKRNETIDMVLYLDVPEEVLFSRIETRIKLAQTTKSEPRADDCEEILEARLEVFKRDTQPLVIFFKNNNKLYTIDGDQKPEVVFEDIKKMMNGRV